MSHFVANSISISKDMNTFKVKGGDNNVVPRSNYWTEDIDIIYLPKEILGGTLRLISKSEKALFILELIDEVYKDCGSWYWNMKNKEPDNPKVQEYDKEFLTKLKQGLKNLSNKNEYLITFETGNGRQYLEHYTKKGARVTDIKKTAKRFKKYRAKDLIKGYSKYNPIIELI